MISLKQALMKNFSPCCMLCRWLGGVAPIALSHPGPFDFALICFATLNLKAWEGLAPRQKWAEPWDAVWCATGKRVLGTETSRERECFKYYQVLCDECGVFN